MEGESCDTNADGSRYTYYHAPTGSDEPRAVLINWHVSGLIVPAIGSDAAICSTVGKSTGIIVVDADNRKAPENPFPAAINEALISCNGSMGSQKSTTPTTFSCQASVQVAISAWRPRSLVDGSSRASRVCSLSIPSPTYTCPPEEKKASAHTQPLLPFVPNFIATYYIPSSGRKDDPRVSPTYASLVTFPSNLF